MGKSYIYAANTNILMNKYIIIHLTSVVPARTRIKNYDNLDLSSKAKQKATLQAFCYFKKQKNMDDLLVIKKGLIVFLHDQWLIIQGKTTIETKAQVKKATNVEKKLVENQNKIRK